MSVTAATGFRASGVVAGVKASGALDVALVAGDGELTAAAVFTRNRAKAAPVQVSKEQLERRTTMRAVVLNSGCANAATGEQGIADARAMVNAAASAVGCSHEEVLVCSTGGIGKPLPVKKVIEGIVAAGDGTRRRCRSRHQSRSSRS